MLRKLLGHNKKWQNADMEDKKSRQGFGQVNCKTRGQLKDPGTDKNIM
jgi:hypothetical protein